MRFYFHEHAETKFDRAVEYYEKIAGMASA